MCYWIYGCWVVLIDVHYEFESAKAGDAPPTNSYIFRVALIITDSLSQPQSISDLYPTSIYGYRSDDEDDTYIPSQRV